LISALLGFGGFAAVANIWCINNEIRDGLFVSVDVPLDTGVVEHVFLRLHVIHIS